MRLLYFTAITTRKETIMKRDTKTFKLLSLYLIVATLLLSMPAQSWAMFIPSDKGGAVRQDDMRMIQKTLESALIKQRLVDSGLSSEEAMKRINTLSDGQIHQLASRLEALQAGGDDGIGALIFILLVAITVVEIGR